MSPLFILFCLLLLLCTIRAMENEYDAIRSAQKVHRFVPSSTGLTLLFDSNPSIQFTPSNCNPLKPISVAYCTPLLVSFLPSIYSTKIYIQTALPDLLFEVSIFPNQEQFTQIINGRHYEYQKRVIRLNSTRPSVKRFSSEFQQDEIPVDYESPIFHPFISQRVSSPQPYGKQFFLSMATEFKNVYFISGKYNPNSDYTILDLKTKPLEEIINTTSRPFASSFKISDYSYDFYQKRFYFGGLYTYSDPSIYRFNYDNNMIDFSRIIVNCFMNFKDTSQYISIIDMHFTDMEYGSPTRIGDLHRYRLFVVGSNDVEYKDKAASRIVNINVNAIIDSYYFDVFPPKGLLVKRLLYAPFMKDVLFAICWEDSYRLFESEHVFAVLKLNSTNGNIIQQNTFGKYDKYETDYTNFEFFFGYGHSSVIFATAKSIFKFDVDTLEIVEEIEFPSDEVIRFFVHNPIVENEFVVLSCKKETEESIYNLYYFRDGSDMRIQDVSKMRDFSFWLLLFSMINLGIVVVVFLIGIFTCFFCIIQNMAARLFFRRILGLGVTTESPETKPYTTLA